MSASKQTNGSPRGAQWPQTAARALALYVTLGGLLSFSGWIFDIERLTGWDGSGISIQPNATLTTTASGLAVLFLLAGRPRVSLVLGTFVATIGLATIFQYVTGVNLGIDGLLLFDRPWGRVGVISPGRMGPPGSASWTLIGISLIFASSSRRFGKRTSRDVAPFLTLATTLISGLSIIGYAYGANVLYTIPTLTIIALQTSTFILAISVAIIFAGPGRGPMLLLADPGPAGTLVRRVLPGLVVLPIVVGVLRLAGERAGLYDLAFGTAARTIVEILLLTLLLWWTASAVRQQTAAREDAEKELEQGAEKLKTTLASITDGFVTLDREWRYTYVNGKAETLLNKPASELLGRVVWDVLPEAKGSTVEEMLRRAVTSGESVEFEAFSSKSNRWHANKVFPTAEGGVSIYFQDVTARRATEEELRESRAQLETDLSDSKLLQELSAGIIHENDVSSMYDRIVDAAHVVTNAGFASLQALEHDVTETPQGLRLLASRGFTPEAISFWGWVGLGGASSCAEAIRTGERIVVPDVSQCAFMAGTDDLQSYLQAGIRAAQSTPLISRDGSVLGMLSTHWSTPHEPTERELSLLDVIARQAADLIERRRHEQALADADRKKDHFLMTLAHELRNPLAPIRSSAEILKRRSPSDADLSRVREVIDRNSHVMARLLDDLMDVARIARDKLGLRPESVEVGELVRSALEACEPETERFNHDISVEIPHEKIYVRGDRVRLGQVVGNLINNACRYTEPGGRIRLSVERVDREAMISVTDSGIGIPADKLSSIFELFSQVDASLERSQGGLGIGLHLAKRLVEMHGGQISASSEGPNRGSTFTVRLPALEAPATITPSAPQETSDRAASPLRVLVVDDNRDGAEMLAAVLEMDQHVVEIAFDGPSAISRAETFQPDMVLLDIGLPLMNGFDVCQRIRKTSWGKRMKLVALTGWGQESDRARSAAAGFDAHLVKPVDHRALSEVLDAASSQRRSGQHLTPAAGRDSSA